MIFKGHEELSAYLFNVLDTEKTGFINFADYMFLRKTNLAWKKCAMDDQISRKNMGCAMTVAVPGRRLYLPDSTELFDMGVLLFKGTPVMDTPYLNFQAFFEISRVYYYFQEFNLPFDNGLLQQKDMIRAINDQMVPHDISPLVVQVFFDSIENPQNKFENTMTFQSFAALFMIFRRFKSHAIENPIYLNQEEFYQMLTDNIADQKILLFIDTFYMTTYPDLDELYADHKGHGEEDFLIQFLQTQFKSKHLLRAKQEDVPPNEVNREAIFKSFDSQKILNLNFADVVNFYKHAWFYVNTASAASRLINKQQLKDGVMNFNSPIKLNQYEKYRIGEFSDYLSITDMANIKHFCAWGNQVSAFADFKAAAFLKRITEEQIHIGLSRIGLLIHQSAVMMIHEGSDQEGVPIYNYQKATRIALHDDIQVAYIKFKQQLAEMAARR